MEVQVMKISTQQKGKQGEFYVFGELLRRGFDLYVPVADVGIDAVVRLKSGTYRELQVKSTQAPDQAGYFSVYDLKPHRSLFIVCVDMSEGKRSRWGGEPEVWILPSHEFLEYATVTEFKDYKRYLLSLPAKDKKHDNKRREEILERYRANTNETAWEMVREDGKNLYSALSEAAEMCGHEIVGHDFAGKAELWYTAVKE